MPHKMLELGKKNFKKTWKIIYLTSLFRNENTEMQRGRKWLSSSVVSVGARAVFRCWHTSSHVLCKHHTVLVCPGHNHKHSNILLIWKEQLHKRESLVTKSLLPIKKSISDITLWKFRWEESITKFPGFVKDCADCHSQWHLHRATTMEVFAAASPATVMSAEPIAAAIAVWPYTVWPQIDEFLCSSCVCFPAFLWLCCQFLLL